MCANGRRVFMCLVHRDGTLNDDWSIEVDTASTSRLFPVAQGVDYIIMRIARAYAHSVVNVTTTPYREIGRRGAQARVRHALADRLPAHRSDAGSLKTRVSASRLSRVGSRSCVRHAAHGAQPTHRGVERRDAWRIRTAPE
jgi:hypothetical protein